MWRGTRSQAVRHAADRLPHLGDTLGAVGAGWQAALVRRPGNDVLGVGPQPRFVGADLSEVADQLIAHFAA